MKVLFNVLIIVAVSMVKTIDILTTFVIQHCVVVMQTVKLILNLSCKTLFLVQSVFKAALM